jgi:outer membrane protein OmpA-like peptidoglycan-associated protein
MLHAVRKSAMSSAAALLALGSVAAGTAHGGDATYLPGDADHCAIFRVLSHDVPGECRRQAEAPEGLRTRSIKLHTREPVAEAPMVVNAAAPTIEPETDEAEDTDPMSLNESDELSLAMRIQFRHNSDVLTDEAKVSLDSIAAVLNNEIMAEKTILLEGHADATGSDGYNLDLSVRRAQAVQEYLISEHEIDYWRLPFVGKGETEPYDAIEPGSSINRRVEFTNITG